LDPGAAGVADRIQFLLSFLFGQFLEFVCSGGLVEIFPEGCDASILILGDFLGQIGTNPRETMILTGAESYRSGDSLLTRSGQI
jgi:hypothetical protein